jgi:hypothetical protein
MHRTGTPSAVETTARIGWLARAVVYALVAVLMAQVTSAGGDDREADRSGAIEAIADAPLGGWLLALIAAGLLAFGAWRVWAAVLGSDEKPLRRLGWLGSAVVYGYLAALAIGVLLSGDDRSGGGGNEEQSLTARVLGWPGGRWLVGAAGLVAMGIACNYVRKAVKERFRHDIDEGAVPSRALPVVRAVGVAGWAGRALVWALAGWFVVRAAVQHDASEPVGFDASLRRLSGEPWGDAVLWVAFAGFLSYGLLCLATSLWLDCEPDGA